MDSEDAARQQWLMDLRRKFSPPGMLSPDGNINQEFFRPKQVIILHDNRKWGEQERDALYAGLEKYGVGKWREIGEELLPGWDETQLRIKTARLLGSQSLFRYQNWTGDRAAVDAERACNREIGEATNCWKGGVLVEDDHGSVKAYLEHLAGQGM